MRRVSAFVAVLYISLVVFSAWAEGRETTLFLVRFPGEGGEVRYKYQDIPSAAAFLFPVPFSAAGGRLELRAASTTGVLEREREVLARRPSGSLVSVRVLVNDTPGKNPKPSKNMTVTFTLDELLARGGAWSGIPAAWGCYTAALKSGWKNGRVWARSIEYDMKRGRFTVKVGLIR